MNELGIALIGCGGMMRVHVRKGFKQLWEKGFRPFKIVACVDVNENAIQKLADEIAQWQDLHPKVYTSVDDFIARETSASAVDISLPHYLHHNVAIACLESGKHVLIEKPLAITMRAAKKIIEAAKNRSLVLSVAENYRRDPQQRSIKWAIKQGRIGEPKQVYWVDVFERLWYWDWRDHLEFAGGGWTLDGGVHFADLMRYHVGEVVEVSAQIATFNPNRFRKVNEHQELVTATIEDTTQALLKFENGALGVWVEAITAPARQIGTRVIYGTEGAIDLNAGLFLRNQDNPIPFAQLQEEFMASLSESDKERLFPLGVMDDIAQEVHEFITACLDNNPKVEIDGEEGYKSQAVCMAIYEAASLKQTISVADVMALKVEAYQRLLNERWQIS
ncbi:MAG: Gfo/Idh/MocA family oxidoreductase [Armatimonadetes bacterium]|nr:Gfo/Idh/MocA family oxidoreductase [Armatimonadota bacterium]